MRFRLTFAYLFTSVQALSQGILPNILIDAACDGDNDVWIV